jgi:hypothetical protein
MASEPQQSNPLLLIVIIGAVIFFATRGGSAPDPVKPDPVKPTPDVVDPKPVTASDAWNMLAFTVEKKLIGGEMQQHTDHILKIVDTLKASGTLPDVARVDLWRAKRIEITDSNRSEIAKQLRGK